MSLRSGTLRPLLVLSTAVLALGSISSAQVHIRPLSDLLQNQGTFTPPPESGCTPYNNTCLFFPPAPNYVAWGARNAAGIADYAALANNYLVQATNGRTNLHTQVWGVVTEQLMVGETRALVDVYLIATNALAFGMAPTFGPPLWFGYQVSEVLNGSPAATGEAYLHVQFLNPGGIGARLPDLVEAMVFSGPGQMLIAYEFACSATGLLRAPSGFPEGTPGAMKIVQTGHIDGVGGFVYPVEIVNFAARRR